MNDDSLDKLIRAKVSEQESTYPSHFQTPDALWKSLTEKRYRYRPSRRKYVWQAAAAALVVMMAGYGYFLYNTPDDSISGGLGSATLSGKEREAVDFITRYCATRNGSCSNPVIQELQGDLEQSFRKLDEINQELQVYGDDADLVRAKARIESHQARLIKTIVQTL